MQSRTRTYVLLMDENGLLMYIIAVKKYKIVVFCMMHQKNYTDTMYLQDKI